MVWLPRAIVVALLTAAVFAVPPAAAEGDFLMLGVDAIEDAELNGVPMLDTWIDINGLAVATIGTDLVFHLGLQGTTTEAGSYCWMAAFTFDGTKYVGLDCYEGVAYESDNTLSGVRPASTSRGTNVASSVVFDADGAVITIPLAAIKAKVGDTISDIYGLTYATRALVAVDTVPDARMSSTATESLGSYVIGGGLSPTAPAGPVYGNLTDGSFRHEFTNATSATYVLNTTLAYAQASVRVDANVTAGSANVTFLQNGTSRLSFLVTNTTDPATGNGTTTGAVPYSLANATGNWSIQVVYDGFVGHLGINVTQAQAAAGAGGTALKPSSVSSGTKGASGTTSGTSTGNATATDEGTSDAPAPGPVVLALVLVALAIVRRRK